MIQCPQCDVVNQPTSRFCSGCGLQFVFQPTRPKANQHIVAAICGALLIVCFILIQAYNYQEQISGNAADGAANITSQTINSDLAPDGDVTKNLKNSDKLTDTEKNYLRAAYSYLRSFADEGEKLSDTMINVGTGEVTLSEAKEAIKHTQTIENASFSNTYHLVAVPKDFSAVDKKILKVHQLQNSGLTEVLRYYKDSNVEHIEKGSPIWKSSILLANESLKDLTKALDAKSSY